MFGAVIAISRLHIRTTPNYGGLTLAKTFKQCFSQEVAHCRLCPPASGVRSFASGRTFTFNKSWRKDNFGWNHSFRRMRHSLFRPSIMGVKKPPNTLTNPLRINTNIKNNVMLYRFEKPYMYKGGMIFAGAALIGCLAMADNIYLILCKDLFNPNKDLLTRILEHILPLSMILVGIVAGPLIFFTVWYITKRTVKYLILHKGGENVTLIMYHPLKGEVKMNVPLANINCQVGRTDEKGYIPLKIKDTKHHYIMDKSGHFVNPELFDATVGAKRVLS